ncbi:MAG: transposase [Desulfobacterales bacterium]
MKNCIGIDISKRTFDVHLLTGSSDHHFDYTPENIRKTAELFLTAKPELIVTEATGGYEIPLAEELYAAGLPAAAVNPARIRNFAKAGQTAKTDKGGGCPHHCPRVWPMELPVRKAHDDISSEIRILVVRKRRLTDMRTAEKNRTEHIRLH